jgi:lysophospholipase L1-like esterase
MHREIRARRLAALAVLALPALAFVQDRSANPAATPAPREERYWRQLHQAFLDRARQGAIDLLFLGDSITQGWGDNATWKRHYGPRHAANFGIGGDRTQHVLWRIQNGEIEGLAPKVAVLMIGTNNIGSDSPEQIAEGVRAIVETLRAKLPDTKILLLGVFPRGANRSRDQDAAEPDPRVGQINALIAKLDDGKMVKYLDISEVFLKDGNIPKAIMPDFLHLSSEGYRRWAEAMEPTLWSLMEAR